MTTMHDSGKRQQFEGGAQRDTADGKPLMHLLSPHVYMQATLRRDGPQYTLGEARDKVLEEIRRFVLGKNKEALYSALDIMFDTFGVECLCEWLKVGAAKYDKFNWAKGMPFTRVLDSLLRHCAKWFDMDEDHPAAIMCNIMFLIHYIEEIENERLHNHWDDLFKFERVSDES